MKNLLQQIVFFIFFIFFACTSTSTNSIDKVSKNLIESLNKCQYSGLSLFSEGLAAVRMNNKWGYIDKKGQEIITCQYEEVLPFSEGLAVVSINDKWGYINKKGQTIIDCQYDRASPFFKENLAAVSKDYKWGFINKNGEEVIPCKYFEALSFAEGLASVRSDNDWGFIDPKGQMIISDIYEKVLPFSEGFAAVSINDKWGYINKEGKEVIPCKYEKAQSFSEGLAVIATIVGKEKRQNNKIIQERWFSNDVNVVKFGVIDTTGNLLYPCIFKEIQIFSDGFAVASLDGKSGFLDKYGKTTFSAEESSSFNKQERNEGVIIEDTNIEDDGTNIQNRKPSSTSNVIFRTEADVLDYLNSRTFKNNGVTLSFINGCLYVNNKCTTRSVAVFEMQGTRAAVRGFSPYANIKMTIVVDSSNNSILDMNSGTVYYSN